MFNDSRPTLLVAENEPLTREALRKKLSDSGFAVVMAYDGEAALQQLQEREFTGIVLDLRLPKKDGIEVLEALPDTVNAASPVYALTNLGGDDRVYRALELGAKRYFAKLQVPLREVVATIAGDLCESVPAA